jgi:hypothetical protein
MRTRYIINAQAQGRRRRSERKNGREGEGLMKRNEMREE